MQLVAIRHGDDAAPFEKRAQLGDLLAHRPRRCESAAEERTIAELFGDEEAVLDVVQNYHNDLAQRFADEAALIPRRTAIAQRLREGEQQKRSEME